MSDELCKHCGAKLSATGQVQYLCGTWRHDPDGVKGKHCLTSINATLQAENERLSGESDKLIVSYDDLLNGHRLENARLTEIITTKNSELAKLREVVEKPPRKRRGGEDEEIT